MKLWYILIVQCFFVFVGNAQEAFRGKMWGSTVSALPNREFSETENDGISDYDGYEDRKDPKYLNGVRLHNILYFYKDNKLVKVKVTIREDKEGDAEAILGYLQSTYGAEIRKDNIYTGSKLYTQTRYTFEGKNGNHIEYYKNDWKDKSIFTDEFVRTNNTIRSYFVIYSPTMHADMSDW